MSLKPSLSLNFSCGSAAINITVKEATLHISAGKSHGSWTFTCFLMATQIIEHFDSQTSKWLLVAETMDLNMVSGGQSWTSTWNFFIFEVLLLQSII